MTRFARPALQLITVTFKNGKKREWGPYTRANALRNLAKIKTTQRDVASVEIKTVHVV